MEKLTQFVSKSFEADESACSMMTSVVKCEDEPATCVIADAKPKAKNWLISDTPSSQASVYRGVDLSVSGGYHPYHLLEAQQRIAAAAAAAAVKWYGAAPAVERECSVSPKRPASCASTASSPIDLEESSSKSLDASTDKATDKATEKAPPDEESGAGSGGGGADGVGEAGEEKKLCK